MKVRLGVSGSGLRRVASVQRSDGTWHPVITFWVDGRNKGEYEVDDCASEREIAVVTLAAACEGIEVTQERRDEKTEDFDCKVCER